MAHNCEKCPVRKIYDRKPKSLVGRLWRWHIDRCPGWKKYFRSLDEDKKEQLRKAYNFLEK